MASLAPVARLGATLEPTGMARLACLAPTLAIRVSLCLAHPTSTTGGQI